MVKNGTLFDYYVNGTSVLSTNTVISEITTTAQMNFGYSSYWNDFHYEGLLDEVRIYDRALNSEEIATLSIPEPATGVIVLGAAAAGWFVRRRFCI